MPEDQFKKALISPEAGTAPNLDVRPHNPHGKWQSRPKIKSLAIQNTSLPQDHNTLLPHWYAQASGPGEGWEL